MTGIKSTNDKFQLNCALDITELIESIDQLFDSVNGISEGQGAGKPLRQAVSAKSLHISQWMRSLALFKTMTKFIKAKTNERSKPPVLNGWIRTLNGFISLRKALLHNGFNKFYPRMFNQDLLEQFFGQIR